MSERTDGIRVQVRKVHASDLAGMLHRKGQRRVSLDEMKAAIVEGARRTQAR